VSAGQAASARRRYRSALRERQAAETRRSIIGAATGLFGERGWAGTGMREVARAAGVSIETVYGNFTSKSELLTACLDVAVVDDATPVPLAQRPAFTALAHGHRAQRIHAAARLAAVINARTAGMLLAVREAAASEPELAAWRQTAEARRHMDIEQAAALIAGRTVTADEVDGLWAVLAVEVYELLTNVRNWTAEQYEQ
jgi:AcrR family transcriptional regulator